MMYAEPAAWKRLMERLVTVISDYLTQQVKAGVSAVQLFDSWVGALSPHDYAKFAAPYNKQIIENVKKTGVPVIYFSTGTSAMLSQIRELGSDVVSIDWRIRLDEAWSQLGEDKAIQGNLDPVLLMAPWREVHANTNDILAQAQGRFGHIFNLGHGILPGTPMDTVRKLIDYVHEKTFNKERVTA
jgi:uroporphyrinogen decarboxylase